MLIPGTEPANRLVVVFDGDLRAVEAIEDRVVPDLVGDRLPHGPVGQFHPGMGNSREVEALNRAVDERDVGVVEGDEAAEFVAAAEALAVGQIGGGVDERGTLHGTAE